MRTHEGGCKEIHDLGNKVLHLEKKVVDLIELVTVMMAVLNKQVLGGKKNADH